jgi:hypothetical protein
LLQSFDYVDLFPYPEWNEMPEHRDIVIGDVPIGHCPHLAVTKMMSYQENRRLFS